MPVTQDTIATLIKEAFPDSKFEIKDLAGDNDHYALEITSPAFRGRSLIEQHKMVKQALKDILSGPLHALTIKTIVPTE